jgi:hypothetical protein
MAIGFSSLVLRSFRAPRCRSALRRDVTVTVQGHSQRTHVDLRAFRECRLLTRWHHASRLAPVTRAVEAFRDIDAASRRLDRCENE